MSVFRAVYELLSRGERRRAAGVLALMLVAAFFELLGVGFILPFLTIAINPDAIQGNPVLSLVYAGLGFEDTTSFVVFAAVVLLAIIVVMNVVSALGVWVQMWFVYQVGHSISVRLMQRYLAKPYTYFLNRNTSELSMNILADTSKIVTGVLKPGAALISRGLVIAAVVGLLLIVQPVFALLTMGVIGGAYAVAYVLIRKKLERLGRQSVEANQQRYQTTQETFGGVKAIKALDSELHFLGEFSGASSRYASYQAANRIYSQMPRFLIQVLAFGGFMVGFILLVASGRDLTDVVPLMGFFAFAAIRLLPGFQEIVSSLAQFRFHGHLLFKIHADLSEDRDPADAPAVSRDDTAPLSFECALGLEGVRFRYPGAEKDVIRELTMEVPKNSSVALVGTTGAGKTTIVDILLGLIAPDEGRLTVDGTSVTRTNATAWRKRVGYVPQDVFLADDTVTGNIAYGVGTHDIDRAAVQRAATTAQIHAFIEDELPEGYNTMIGERGVRLSGGQRQRLGIARALYRDPDVLILDEATSDVDTVTEAYITEAIRALAGQKTLVIVAHRLATIQHCDRIYLLRGGATVASGSYDELVASSPEFQRMTGAARVEPVL